MATLGKIISTILYAALVAIIVGVAGLLLATRLPIPGNIEMKIVKSGSMEPYIMTGSIVIVKPSANYAVGDVITFGKDTKTDVPTTHRIVEIRDAQGSPVYTTKGDANEEADPNPAARRDVIGKVVFHMPYVGYLLDFARQPIGFALLIAIPAGLVILEELITIAREAAKWRRGRRGGGGSGGGSGAQGSPVQESFGEHLRLAYVKRFKMDEIYVRRPWPGRLIRPTGFARFLHSDSYGTSTALVIGLVMASSFFSSASGGTLAYFSDFERSLGNTFAAGTWEDEPEIPSVELLGIQSLMSIDALPGDEDTDADEPADETTDEATDDISPADDGADDADDGDPPAGDAPVSPFTGEPDPSLAPEDPDQDADAVKEPEETQPKPEDAPGESPPAPPPPPEENIAPPPTDPPPPADDSAEMPA